MVIGKAGHRSDGYCNRGDWQEITSAERFALSHRSRSTVWACCRISRLLTRIKPAAPKTSSRAEIMLKTNIRSMGMGRPSRGGPGLEVVGRTEAAYRRPGDGVEKAGMI